MSDARRPLNRPASTALAVAIAAGVAAGVGLAQSAPKPYASADPTAGKALSDKDCVTCHAAKFGGDATRIYTRPDRRVRTPAQLVAQVQYCNTEIGLAYFPDDEADVAAYLDREHYRFAP
ncbi:Green heme protein [Burkholderiales bacterium]|nr:Green heme protein [Burkholderiales bacterium]